MQMHELKNPERRYKKRIGRGGKRGSYSGRGVKGQHAHAGGRLPAALAEAVKIFPKLRGARQRALRKPKPVAVSLGVLSHAFQDGASVTLQSLREAGVLKGDDKAKIVDGGELTKKLSVQGVPISKAAKEKVEKAGGSVVTG